MMRELHSVVILCAMAVIRAVPPGPGPGPGPGPLPQNPRFGQRLPDTRIANFPAPAGSPFGTTFHHQNVPGLSNVRDPTHNVVVPQPFPPFTHTNTPHRPTFQGSQLQPETQRPGGFQPTVLQSFGHQRHKSCGIFPNPGECQAAFPRYYYNNETSQCDCYLYGGCDEGEGSYRTLEECHQKCIPDLKTEGPTCKFVYIDNFSPFTQATTTSLPSSDPPSNINTPTTNGNQQPFQNAAWRPSSVGRIPTTRKPSSPGSPPPLSTNGRPVNGQPVSAFPFSTRQPPTSQATTEGIPHQVNQESEGFTTPGTQSATWAQGNFPQPGIQRPGSSSQHHTHTDPSHHGTQGSGGLPQNGTLEQGVMRPHRPGTQTPIPIETGTMGTTSMGPGTQESAQKDKSCGIFPNPGECQAAFPRYYYNSETSQCDCYLYGGCDEGKGSYRTLEECHQKCLPDLKTEGPSCKFVYIDNFSPFTPTTTPSLPSSAPPSSINIPTTTGNHQPFQNPVVTGRPSSDGRTTTTRTHSSPGSSPPFPTNGRPVNGQRISAFPSSARQPPPIQWVGFPGGAFLGPARG